jgi:hypothetical protein
MRAAQNVSEKEEQLQPEFLASNAKQTACVDEFATGWALGYGITHDKHAPLCWEDSSSVNPAVS